MPGSSRWLKTQHQHNLSTPGHQGCCRETPAPASPGYWFICLDIPDNPKKRFCLDLAPTDDCNQWLPSRSQARHAPLVKVSVLLQPLDTGIIVPSSSGNVPLEVGVQLELNFQTDVRGTSPLHFNWSCQARLIICKGRINTAEVNKDLCWRGAAMLRESRDCSERGQNPLGKRGKPGKLPNNLPERKVGRMAWEGGQCWCRGSAWQCPQLLPGFGKDLHHSTRTLRTLHSPCQRSPLHTPGSGPLSIVSFQEEGCQTPGIGISDTHSSLHHLFPPSQLQLC